ncbi:hypothetical protein RSAG8_09090, partial [Rhizoctonia solani AG-8 WAC10335]
MGHLPNGDGAQTISIFDFDSLAVGRYVNRSRPNYIQTALSPREERDITTAVRNGDGLFIPESAFHTKLHTNRPFQPSNEVFVNFVGRDQPTVLQLGFQKSVQSRLPYRTVTQASRVLTSEGYFIDGSRIIAIHQWADNYEFHVFRLNVGDDVVDQSDG